MANRGNPIFKEDYIGTTLENTFSENVFPKLQEQDQEQIGYGEEESERLYDVPFEELDMFRRHT